MIVITEDDKNVFVGLVVLVWVSESRGRDHVLHLRVLQGSHVPRPIQL